MKKEDSDEWYNKMWNYSVEAPFDITVEGNRQTDITVENEKKKGNIKVIKQDSENGEIKLSRC